MTGRWPPAARADAAAVTAVGLWLLGASQAHTFGIWFAVGVTAVLLGLGVLAVGGRSLGGRPISATGLAAGAGVGLAMAAATMVLFGPATALMPGLRDDVVRLYAAFGHPDNSALLLGLPLIVVCEELVWRGAVFGALAGRLPRGLAVAGGALLYAAAHAPVGSPALVLTCLAVGLCWNALRAQTNSLAVVVVAHIVWDFIVLVGHRMV